MTTLSNNIQRLKDDKGYSIKFIADQCGVSPAAASQWMQKKNPYVPSIDSLLTLAGLFQVTIEDLVTNPKCKSGDVITPVLNFIIVEHIFKLVEPDSVLRYAFDEAAPKKKAYMFGLMYSLFEETGIAKVTIADVLETMSMNQDAASAKPAKRKNSKGTIQRNSASPSRKKS